MNRIEFHAIRHRLAVDGLAQHVPDAANGLGTDGHHHGLAGVLDLDAALQAIGGGHGNRTDNAARQLALDLQDVL